VAISVPLLREALAFHSLHPRHSCESGVLTAELHRSGSIVFCCMHLLLRGRLLWRLSLAENGPLATSFVPGGIAVKSVVLKIQRTYQKYKTVLTI
jgi:hypothetical protein